MVSQKSSFNLVPNGQKLLYHHEVGHALSCLISCSWCNIRDKTAPSYFSFSTHAHCRQTHTLAQESLCPLIYSHLLISADGRTVAQMAICPSTHTHTHTKQFLFFQYVLYQPTSGPNIISRECAEKNGLI